MADKINQRIESLIEKLKEDPTAELGFYDELAFLYEFLYGDQYDYELQAEIADRYQEEAPERILDIGCGAGHLIEELRSRFPEAEIHGIDINNEMLELAEEKIQSEERTELKNADIFETYLDGEYDVITCFGSNPHFDKDKHRELFDIASTNLKENGILVFDHKDPKKDVNGRYTPWKEETKRYSVTSHFITVYNNGQPYYTNSYEFFDKEKDETYYTGSLIQIHLHPAERLKKQIERSDLKMMNYLEGKGDQSGIFITRKN